MHLLRQVRKFRKNISIYFSRDVGILCALFDPNILISFKISPQNIFNTREIKIRLDSTVTA